MLIAQVITRDMYEKLTFKIFATLNTEPTPTRSNLGDADIIDNGALLDLIRFRYQIEIK